MAFPLPLTKFRVGLWALLFSSQLTLAAEVRLAPGDDKSNYEDRAYRTDSLSVQYRRGEAADLLKIAVTPQLGLPPMPVPADNLFDSKRIQLGRKLFFDRRLSLNKTMSCAMCHIPEQGFTSNELATPIGFEGRSLKRNAPTLLNVGFYPRLFHDGRESRLEQQVWSPLLAKNEMNNPSVGYVIDTINRTDNYKERFQEAFGTEPNMLTVGMALAQYQRALVAGNSRFDRWYYGKVKNELSDREIRGFQLFVGKARCANCHTINKGFALFTDHKFHNTGLGYAASIPESSDKVTVQVAPGNAIAVEKAIINQVGVKPDNDLGRYEVTQNPAERWQYRTPTLRNIALTAPYMHDGSLASLRQVLNFYNKGGVPHELLSPLMTPLGLSDEEMADILLFLGSLTGNSVKSLVSDAYAAPIGDQLSDRVPGDS